MATPTSYTYSIAEDTAEGKVCLGRLTLEIQQSSIVTALDYCGTVGDVLTIYMKDILSEGDATTLTSVVNAHKGESLTPSPVEVVLASSGGTIAESSDGIPQVNPIPAIDSKMACFCPSVAGELSVATPYVDYTVVDSYVQLAGVELQLTGAETWDELKFQVGMIVDGDFVVISEYGGKKLITTDWEFSFLSPLRSNAILQGLKLRIAMVFANPETTNKPKLSVLYHLWRPYA